MRFPAGSSRSSEVCCQDRNIRTCVKAEVDKDLLLDREDIYILDENLKFVSTIGTNGFCYRNDDGDEAVITYNENTGNMFGSFKTHEGKSYAIERCHNGHVWKEFDVPSFGEDVLLKTDQLDITPRGKSDDVTADNFTQVTYSVMFYFTPEFSFLTADIPGYIDQVIAETNQGYANSQIPVRVSRHCIEAATINDIADTSTFIQTFRDMKGSVTALRNTADAAALLAGDFNSCGVAYLATYSSGNTVSVAQKSCALGYFSFGHELGHNFGCHHNPETATNSYFSHGHGHLISSGAASTGYRTILAYFATGHATRVNFYSNPSVLYPVTGTSTGLAGLSNNAAVITANRFSMASLGDESATCSDGTTITTQPTTTTQASSIISGSTANVSTSTIGNCGNCVFPFIYQRRIFDRCTSIDGDAPWCSVGVDSSGVHISGLWEYCTQSSCPGLAANPEEQMTAHPLNTEGSCCEYSAGEPSSLNQECSVVTKDWFSRVLMLIH